MASFASATPTQLTIGRETYYTQSAASTVAVSDDSENPYRFEAYLQEDSSTSVYSAGHLVTPDTISFYPAWSSDDEAWEMEYKVNSNEKTYLETYFPTGTYYLTMTKTAGGTDEVSVALSSITTPDAPVISNYTALQSIDATSALTVAWTAWSSGTSSDYIQVKIKDSSDNEVFASTEPGKTGALTGTATSVSVPANTLTSGVTYTLTVNFIDILNQTTVTMDSTDVSAITYAQSSTSMSITTAGQTPLSDLLNFSLEAKADYTISTINDDVCPGISTFDSYTPFENLLFTKLGATDTIDPSAVTFTLPSSSTVDATSVVSFTDNGTIEGYTYVVSDLTAYLATGTYSVDYDGTTYSGSITDTPTSADMIYFVPTLTLSDGKITALSWATYDVSEAALDISSYSGYVCVKLYNSSGSSIYENDGISCSTTSLDLSSASVSIYDVSRLVIFYSTTNNEVGLNNMQVATTYNLTVDSSASIFSSLTHSYYWIIPYSTVTNSFGWVNDEYYPWIYSISEDTLANGGTYMADGKGWLYVWYNGASLTNFYFYRSSTGSWCWTNYEWCGWIYDYSIGWVDLTPKS